MTKKDKINAMLSLQNQLNTRTAGDQWISGVTSEGREINWERCIYMEACELLDSFNWRHWKSIDKPDDLDNAKMEAIDVFHFVMSLAIESGTEDILTDVFVNNVTTGNAMINNIEGLVVNCIFHGMNLGIDTENLEAIYTQTNSIFYGLQMSVDDIYRLYVIKNTLNTFRQDNGYKEGTYHKFWFGQEDNEVAQKYWDDSYTSQDFYNKLTELYKGVK